MDEAPIRAAFGQQAAWCRRLGGDFTARLCEALAQVLDRTTATGTRTLDWTGDPLADALVLRLTGGLNALVRRGDLPDLAALYPPDATLEDAALAAALALALADDRLLPWLDSAPQTNEVARSGVLMPGMLTIAAETRLPLRLFELGASAGLNLRMDAYGYRLGGVAFGPADPPLTLAPQWDGPPPPVGSLDIVARRGVDLAPVDLRAAATRERLLAYVWPEQAERIARLEAAIAAFIADPVPLDPGDAAGWVAEHVAPLSGTATVVYHSIAWQYFPVTTRAAITAHLEHQGGLATADAPLAWLRFEFEPSGEVGASPTLRLRSWPGGEDRLLAHVHPHGASVRWLA